MLGPGSEDTGSTLPPLPAASPSAKETEEAERAARIASLSQLIDASLATVGMYESTGDDRHAAVFPMIAYPKVSPVLKVSHALC